MINYSKKKKKYIGGNLKNSKKKNNIILGLTAATLTTILASQYLHNILESAKKPDNILGFTKDPNNTKQKSRTRSNHDQTQKREKGEKSLSSVKVKVVSNTISQLEKLKKKLARHNLQISHIEGDGNCQFRAAADQYNQLSNHNMYDYKTLRNLVVEFIRVNKDLPYANNSNRTDTFEKRIEDSYLESFDQFLNRMKRDKEWGDQLTLVVMSAILMRPFHVYSSLENSPEPLVIESPSHWIHGSSITYKKPLIIAYYPYWHYDSTRPL